MHYVYVLQSEKTGRFYIGQTADLRSRLYQHNSGKSTATKPYMPWKLVYYEAYVLKTHAIVREMKLKHHGKGFAELKKRIGF